LGLAALGSEILEEILELARATHRSLAGDIGVLVAKIRAAQVGLQGRDAIALDKAEDPLGGAEPIEAAIAKQRVDEYDEGGGRSRRRAPDTTIRSCASSFAHVRGADRTGATGSVRTPKAVSRRGVHPSARTLLIEHQLGAQPPSRPSRHNRNRDPLSLGLARRRLPAPRSGRFLVEYWYLGHCPSRRFERSAHGPVFCHA